MGRGGQTQGRARGAAPELDYEAAGYLKALRLAADHVSASDDERDELERLFLRVCQRHGLDPRTTELLVEVLT